MAVRGVRDLMTDHGREGVGSVGHAQDAVEDPNLAVRIREGVDLFLVEYDDLPVEVGMLGR